jgi:hypothetical protein
LYRKAQKNPCVVANILWWLLFYEGWLKGNGKVPKGRGGPNFGTGRNRQWS